ncbi:hypothetical protein ACQP2P_16605 [Dactylosporangium sp. CA-139114]|uniref:hypothetical protein n=1 Tax=Dactylosporangium sp. CA-139114 TaxID=3239931 RepID=UPI003D96CBE4
MTRYAVDVQRSELHAVWRVGFADTTQMVAALPPEVAAHEAESLAAAMTSLSTALWRRYTHPSTATRGDEDTGEGRQRREMRALVGDVTSAVRSPNLPIDNMLIVSYDPVEEQAHRVGRALHAIGSEALADAVLDDIEFELAAVADAEAGSLVGRAQHAISLTRQEASPAQVAAADRLLHHSLLNPRELLQSVDPTSAAVAAAHWLHAAAEVVSEHLGISPVAVIQEADTIEATPQETPVAVLDLMKRQISPQHVVTDLIRDAMLVAEGLRPKTATRNVRRRTGAASAQPMRLTPLDPRRPAQGLLEDLLAGIRGCWLVYPQCVDYDNLGDITESQIDEMFVAEVRIRASQLQSRLD